MGIRIHKVLGYGLQDVSCSGYKIQDNRFSDNLEDVLDYAHERVDDFGSWVLGNVDEAKKICSEFNGEKKDDSNFPIKFLKKDIQENKLHKDIFIHDTEGELTNIFLICPPDQKEWYRYNDAIDYYDCDRGSNLEGSIKEIECGIYPYIMMVRIPGTPDFDGDMPKLISEETRGIRARSISPATFQQLTGRWDKNISAPNQELANYLLETYRPSIPESVILLCHYFKIFKDLNVAQQLRPFLYTFWS